MHVARAWATNTQTAATAWGGGDQQKKVQSGTSTGFAQSTGRWLHAMMHGPRSDREPPPPPSLRRSAAHETSFKSLGGMDDFIGGRLQHL